MKCDYELKSYEVCKLDGKCVNRMQLSTVDYITFTHLLQKHVIDKSFPHTDSIITALEEGSLCNNTAILELWLNQMRNTYICEHDMEYEIDKGCVCKTIHGCKKRRKGNMSSHNNNNGFLYSYPVIIIVLSIIIGFTLYFASIQAITRRSISDRIKHIEDSIHSYNQHTHVLPPPSLLNYKN